MATLTTLYPDGDGTVTSVDTTGTNRWDQINSDPDTAPTTGTYIQNSNNTATCELWMTLTGVDSDLGNMDTIQFLIYVQSSGTRSDDDNALSIGITTADAGGTYLAGASSSTRESITTWNAGNDPPATQVYVVNATYVNTGAAKSAWDGAYLHIRWDYTKSGGWDNIKLQVAAVEIEGTYTAAAAVIYAPWATPHPYPIPLETGVSSY